MKLASILKTPLWSAALATGAKSFAANPVIGNRWLNEHGLHVGRVRLAAHMAKVRRRRLASAVDVNDRQQFEQNGYVLRENFLPQAEFEQLRHEVFDNDWPLRAMRQGDALTRRVPLDPGMLQDSCPALIAIARDSRLTPLIRYVASASGQPIFSLQAVLAEATATGVDPQSHLHADTFHATAKSWLFLHDVGPDDGPFAYVPGSHRRTPAR